MKKIAFIVLVLIFYIGCEPKYFGNGVQVYNKSTHDIAVVQNTLNSDTALPWEEPVFYPVRRIVPGRSFSITHHMDHAEYFKTLPEGVLVLFVIHADTLDKYPWEVIRDEYKILKRYEITYDERIKESTYFFPYP